MNLLDEYVAYLKDNPRGYWFKQKLYGIGWMPAKVEGWTILAIYLVFVLSYLVFTKTYVTESHALVWTILPVAVATLILIIIAWRTGEPLQWRWGRKNTNDQ